MSVHSMWHHVTSMYYRLFNQSPTHLCLGTLVTSKFCCLGLPWWLVVKNPPANAQKCGFDPWVGTIPWRRKWQPIPVLLAGESHGQRSLAGRKELDKTEHTHTHTHILHIVREQERANPLTESSVYLQLY